MVMLKLAMRWLMGILLILIGIRHLTHPEFFVKIMPPYLPWHLKLVYASGAAEILLGAMLLVPRASHLAAWGIMALLIAVFPANVHMAMHPELFPDLSPMLLYLRIPLQGVFIAWAYWFTECHSSE